MMTFLMKLMTLMTWLMTFMKMFMKLMKFFLVVIADTLDLLIMDLIARILVYTVTVSIQIYFDLPVTPIDYIFQISY